MKMKKRVLFVFLLSVVLIGTTLFPVFAQDEQPKPGGKLVLTVTSITHLDPCSVAQENELYPLIYEGLFELDKDLNPTPLLAKSFEISEDGLTHTIYLQEGVTFEDGTPFNAEAAKWNLDRKIELKLPYFDSIP
ncbi:MAG: ABC transporter substrate-binding protein, partial [Crenarchaeota archaeon]|nr:ABC transporter substrate-binding protein [Thermoproteota archaeon]